jgi:hypothetical protein
MDKHKLKINTDLIDDMGEIDEVNINGTDFVPKPESTNGEIFFTCCDANTKIFRDGIELVPKPSNPAVMAKPVWDRKCSICGAKMYAASLGDGEHHNLCPTNECPHSLFGWWLK